MAILMCLCSSRLWHPRHSPADIQQFRCRLEMHFIVRVLCIDCRQKFHKWATTLHRRDRDHDFARKFYSQHLVIYLLNDALWAPVNGLTAIAAVAATSLTCSEPAVRPAPSVGRSLRPRRRVKRPTDGLTGPSRLRTPAALSRPRPPTPRRQPTPASASRVAATVRTARVRE